MSGKIDNLLIRLIAIVCIVLLGILSLVGIGLFLFIVLPLVFMWLLLGEVKHKSYLRNVDSVNTKPNL